MCGKQRTNQANILPALGSLVLCKWRRLRTKVVRYRLGGEPWLLSQAEAAIDQELKLMPDDAELKMRGI